MFNCVCWYLFWRYKVISVLSVITFSLYNNTFALLYICIPLYLVKIWWYFVNICGYLIGTLYFDTVMVVCHCLLTALLFDTNINTIARWRQNGTGCRRKSWPRISVYSWIFEWRSDTEKLPAVLKAQKEKKIFFTRNMWNKVAKELKGISKPKKIPGPEQYVEKSCIRL